ncbi:DNA repair exonuclease [Streptosporangium sandarakinum]|uniref:DNA repair exonuclease SbcCD nuclease subunit n=1 Tax=Streptosporangium sandarakinum TaxID=1260955 RepID=A0A852V5Y1_9ACTN|nr:DNA repair exonuclease [Streptosporangium sandarakinum]NYF43889.1 DNA repair exonuclease SbcCD nuclease subunit [Streptosporangium sandarakinum]
MKLLHAADLHIDSPLRGLSAYEGAPAEKLRTASRLALENLVDLAVSESVDAVLLAGDVYDGTWPDYQTGLFFAGQMSRLGREGIQVYMVYGNHDAQNRMTKQLRLPSNVHLFDTSGPQTILDEARGLAVHGQGFARSDITDNLSLAYPAPRADLFNVGLLHTALTGREGHDRYAPCSVNDLAAKGYDYWALGHVHHREVVSEDPWIVFPGNIQGRHARETGPKGCTLVTVDDLKVVSAVHHDLDVARWEHLRIDVSGAADVDSAVDLVVRGLREIPGDRLHAVRVSVTGSSPAHLPLWRERPRFLNEVRLAATDQGELWVEKVRIETRPPDAPDEGAAGILPDLRRTADALRADGDALRKLVETTPLYPALPPDVFDRDGTRLGDPQWLLRIADDAFELLESMVTEGRSHR